MPLNPRGYYGGAPFDLWVDLGMVPEQLRLLCLRHLE